MQGNYITPIRVGANRNARRRSRIAGNPSGFFPGGGGQARIETIALEIRKKMRVNIDAPVCRA
jgi:hypothetical protein